MNRPDLWDTLLQSGPTLSPTRRRQLQRPARPAASSADGSVGDEEGRQPAGSMSPVPDDERAATARSGASVGDGDGGGEAGVRRRRMRLAPAELQAQLLNELRLHDDLQDAELQADGLMAAQRVEEARQEARVAGLLLRREKVRAGGACACQDVGMCLLYFACVQLHKKVMLAENEMKHAYLRDAPDCHTHGCLACRTVCMCKAMASGRENTTTGEAWFSFA